MKEGGKNKVAACAILYIIYLHQFQLGNSVIWNGNTWNCEMPETLFNKLNEITLSKLLLEKLA